MGSTATWGLVAAVFAASLVEFVEAFTTVLAMGTLRGWRSALAGAALAVVALAGFTVAVGYALVTWLPESALLLIGTLLLIFGLQWLRRAILRSAGLGALHDEEAFREQSEAARRASGETRFGFDWYAFVISFSGFFLEGLEVVFIVITLGLNADNVPLAAAGALAAGVVEAVVRRRREVPQELRALPLRLLHRRRLEDRGQRRRNARHRGRARRDRGVRRDGDRADRLGGHLAPFRDEPDRRHSLALHRACAA